MQNLNGVKSINSVNNPNYEKDRSKKDSNSVQGLGVKGLCCKKSKVKGLGSRGNRACSGPGVKNRSTVKDPGGVRKDQGAAARELKSFRTKCKRNLAFKLFFT